METCLCSRNNLSLTTARKHSSKLWLFALRLRSAGSARKAISCKIHTNYVKPYETGTILHKLTEAYYVKKNGPKSASYAKHMTTIYQCGDAISRKRYRILQPTNEQRAELCQPHRLDRSPTDGCY